MTQPVPARNYAPPSQMDVAAARRQRTGHCYWGMWRALESRCQSTADQRNKPAPSLRIPPEEWLLARPVPCRWVLPLLAACLR